MPTIRLMVAARSFGGPMMPELAAVCPLQTRIDRARTNSRADATIRAALLTTGQENRVLGRHVGNAGSAAPKAT